MVKTKPLRVIELFAGVGGFRFGLEKADKEMFDVVWANQWEPSRKSQDAFECYVRNFKNGQHSNVDIATVEDDFFAEIKPDLLVGGFPCQDYSVARTKSGEKGIQGKKGVLFWEIQRAMGNGLPKYVLLENVDRLLKTPASQRGRDFAVMLKSFDDLGYDVEWRVINAAEYGFAQRRRRIFIFAYRRSLNFSKQQRALTEQDVVFKKGFFAKPFPVEEKPFKERVNEGKLLEDIVEISDNFSFEFHPAGVMRDGKIFTSHVVPIEREPITLGEILQEEVDEKYYLIPEQEKKFEYLRGAKREERVAKNGHKYMYTEGGMSPVDSLDKPGRTMLTSEGSTNRSTHIVEVNGKKRILTPVECERLNGFPDNWTEGMTDRMRYFCMGNALVVGLIEMMGRRIVEIEKSEIITEEQLTFL
ncbi:DNA (cytosine-5-)-methyltransferase [Massilibacterium senegalense]|uniref:DNA (cytosine-5-)-methyltransferase n=1 Tax=Massilibacterium senegalense TaxID=1632858 RepID=UPI00078442D7|nr:DNA (cytosine-5-)-methyltransferase [Massilibacterium senegalense]